MTHQSRQYYGPTVSAAHSFSSQNSYYVSGPAGVYRQPTSTEYLPIYQHLKPNRKDLPLLLNGTPCRACADFGASANVIDAKFARELDLTIDSITPCPAFELPTFRKLLKPSGRVSINCEFPEEPASCVVEEFFVIENFVHSVVMGRTFLRKTRTIDKFRNRLKDKLLQIHEIPVVASLGVQDERLRFWLDGQELMSTPDTGSEINVMSLSFAKQRAFVVKEDPIHQVRFADSSLQDIEGVVSVPVSFGNGAPPKLLLKLVDPDLRNYSPTIVRTGNAMNEIDRPIDYGSTASILADFHILAGLKVDIIFGEDLLATVNAFVRHSTDFDETASSLLESPSLATMGLVKKTGKLVCSVLGKQQTQSKMIDSERERDIADSKELDRYEKEKNDIRKLVGDEKASAERRNEQKRREYTESRRVLTSLNGS
jgi:hypothetical protein